MWRSAWTFAWPCEKIRHVVKINCTKSLLVPHWNILRKKNASKLNTIFPIFSIPFLHSDRLYQTYVPSQCNFPKTNKQALHLRKRFPKLQDLADFSAKKQSKDCGAGYEIKCFPKKKIKCLTRGPWKIKYVEDDFSWINPAKMFFQKNVCHKWWLLNEMKQLTTNPTTKWLPTHDHSKMMSNLRLPYHAPDPSNIMSNIWLPSSTPATWCQITSHQLWPQHSFAQKRWRKGNPYGSHRWQSKNTEQTVRFLLSVQWWRQLLRSN